MDNERYNYFFVIISDGGKIHNTFIHFDRYIDQSALEEALDLITKEFGVNSAILWFKFLGKVYNSDKTEENNRW